MNRRQFVKQGIGGLVGITTASLVGCGRESLDSRANTPTGPASRGRENFVTLYDTYAQALYFDGGLGPKTGIIKVDYILADQPITLEFWHGHGGRQHRYILTPTHFHELKQLKRVYLMTDEVASHQHKLFIDPVDPRWRVPGAQPVQVPLEAL